MLVGVTSVLACQTEHTAPVPQAITVNDAPRTHPDPGPKTVRSTGERAAEVLPELAVQADATEVTDRGTYLRVLVPESRPGVIIPDLRAGELTVTGPVHGTAVPAVDGLMVDNPWIYLRFPRGVKPPPVVSVDGRMSAARLRRGARIRLVISHDATTQTRARLERAYLLAASRWFRGRPGWFSRFAASRLAAMATPSPEVMMGRAAAETMRLAAEHEVMGDLLQDRGAWKQSYLSQSTRWFKRLERPVPGGRRSPNEPVPPRPEWSALAQRIPKDAMVLLAPSVNALGQVARELEDGFRWVAPLLAAEKGLYQPVVKVFRTLNTADLVRSDSEGGPLRIALYSRSVSQGELADVTLIAQFQSPADLRARLEARGLGQDGVSGLQRAGNRFLGWKDAFLVIGRYRKDVQRALNTESDGIDTDPYFWWHFDKAMPEAPGRVFAFVGYGAWARFFSPENRQAIARQRVARSELLAVEFCRMLFEWQEGRAPKGTRELLETGYLRAAELKHDDGRGSISLGTVAESNWGRSDHLLPDEREVPLTAQEADGYGRFLEKWQPILRTRARPVSLRVSRTDNTARASVLASALDPRYFPGSLSVWSPNAQIPNPSLTSGLTVAAALGDTSELRRWLESTLRTAGRRREISLKWAGSWLRLDIPDRASVSDSVQRALEVPEKTIRQGADPVTRRKAAIAQFPGTLVTPLVEPAALAQTLRLLKAGLRESLDGQLNWRELAPYRGFKMTRFFETLSQEGSRLGVSIAHSSEWVVVALNQTSAELAINRLIDDSPSPERILALEGTLNGSDAKWVRMALAGIAETVVFPRRLQALGAARSPHRAEGNPYGVKGRPQHGVYHPEFGLMDAPVFRDLSEMAGPFSAQPNALHSLSIQLKNEASEAALRATLEWSRKARE